MAEFSPGDVVVLKSGSMRMLVERIEGDSVAVVWANDGGIGRDVLPAFALNKWEDRGPSEHRGPPRDARPPRPFGGGAKFGGDRPGGGKPYGPKPAFGDRAGGDRAGGDRAGGDRTGGKPGMDGKPRQKNFYRKDN